MARVPDTARLPLRRCLAVEIPQRKLAFFLRFAPAPNTELVRSTNRIFCRGLSLLQGMVPDALCKRREWARSETGMRACRNSRIVRGGSSRLNDAFPKALRSISSHSVNRRWPRRMAPRASINSPRFASHGTTARGGASRRNGATDSPSSVGRRNSLSTGPCGGSTLFHGALSWLPDAPADQRKIRARRQASGLRNRLNKHQAPGHQSRSLPERAAIRRSALVGRFRRPLRHGSRQTDVRFRFIGVAPRQCRLRTPRPGQARARASRQRDARRTARNSAPETAAAPPARRSTPR